MRVRVRAGFERTLSLSFSLTSLWYSLSFKTETMFDFQKLQVYEKSKAYNKEIKKLITESNFDRVTQDQLRLASFSIMLNIAEGSSRFSNRDRKNFIVIARGSAFECVSILEYLADNDEITESIYTSFYSQLEEISKMLFSLIKKLGE